MDIARSLKLAATPVIGARGKKLIKYAMLRARMAAGREAFTSIHGNDRTLLPHLPERGFFIEAGGNDGFSNSDTFYLEKGRGWRGFLVEPSPELASFARRIRSVPVIHAALGPPDRSGEIVTMTFHDSMTGVHQKESTKWGGWFGPNPATISARMTTLSTLIAEAEDPVVDFLALDVEDFELEALQGLDLARHRPRVMMIETSRPEAVRGMLDAYYDMIGLMPPRDLLFRLRD